MTYLKTLLGSAALIGFLTAPSQAATSGTLDHSQAASIRSASVMDQFSQFKPNPSSYTRLDFEVMDLLVERIVLYMGPSLRKMATRPDAFTGTRVVKKHTSPYRLEGNKIIYSMFDNTQKNIVRDYLKDLTEIPDKVDLTSLSRNDQLSYWFNLHNLALIKEIMEVYPKVNPKDIKPRANSDAKLHDAKILVVKGVPLSLRDIRENIVYRYWDNPIVIYGFHDGTLGSPSLPAVAFDRNNIDYTLRQNAEEFINSLRGFGFGKIAPYYKEVAPRYFPNLEADLRQHFKRYMRPEVYAEVEKTSAFKYHRTMDIISDTTGGYGKYAAPQNLYINNEATDIGIPTGTVDFVRQRARKVQQLQETEWFLNNTVIIEDIDTIDPDLDLPKPRDPGVDVDIHE
ncbi:uncharacterized protein DUF547 [Litorimonas taeanensis]|uniref:Uncharacterized protein DUF547 n=1 Tax=Litorimonas taeanensis TaxID=568099 RepID=A0A420WD13_9PROT|nr:DUF547 domain-containing protein [Litorimonas taeanensis]RKQ68868.1 uncharacterized protein DUF547 [Litorimonas taeanensis]